MYGRCLSDQVQKQKNEYIVLFWAYFQLQSDSNIAT